MVLPVTNDEIVLNRAIWNDQISILDASYGLNLAFILMRIRRNY